MAIKYDPMTGEPIVVPDEAQPQAPAQDAAQPQYQPQYQPQLQGDVYGAQAAPMSPLDAPKKSNKGLFIGLGVAAGVLIIGILVAVIAISGIFTPKKLQVAKAVQNTLKMDSALLKELTKAGEVFTNKEYTVSVEIEDTTRTTDYIDGTISVSKDKKQLALDCNAEDVLSFSLLGELNDHEIKAELPEFADYVFSYDYKDTKNGYLADYLGEETFDILDEALQMIYDPSAGEMEEYMEYAKDVEELGRKYAGEIKFENAESEKFKVGDQKVSCKGIVATIEQSTILDYMDEMYELYLDNYEEALNEMSALTGVDLVGEIDVLYEEFRDYFVRDGFDIYVTFYIYKNALACVRVEAEDVDEPVIEVLFKGDKQRAGSITVKCMDYEVLTFSLKDKNDLEIYKISLDGEDFSLSYDKENGDMIVSWPSYYGEEEFYLNLSGKNGEYSLYTDEFPSLEVTVTVSKGATSDKFLNEDVFDLGNADAEEFTALLFEYYDTLEDLADLLF